MTPSRQDTTEAELLQTIHDQNRIIKAILLSIPSNRIEISRSALEDSDGVLLGWSESVASGSRSMWIDRHMDPRPTL